MDLVLVAAVADNGVIGIAGGLPWHLPGDLKRFRALTLGHWVVMGRRTWESIGRPLAGRTNLVVSSDATLGARLGPAGLGPGEVTVVPSLDDAIATAGTAGAATLFVIGGSRLYRDALPRATRIVLTQVRSAPQGDTHFPTIDMSRWCEQSRERFDADGDAPAFEIVVLQASAPPDSPTAER